MRMLTEAVLAYAWLALLAAGLLIAGVFLLFGHAIESMYDGLRPRHPDDYATTDDSIHPRR